MASLRALTIVAFLAFAVLHLSECQSQCTSEQLKGFDIIGYAADRVFRLNKYKGKAIDLWEEFGKMGMWIEEKEVVTFSMSRDIHKTTTTMIHPINIPEDLMAANPKREQFLPQRRRPTLTYTPDGRRMLDGQPTTPNEPGKLWNDFFLRSITRCLVAESESSAQEQGALLDVVDLSPSSPPPGSLSDVPDSPPPFHHLVSSIASGPNPVRKPTTHKKLARTESVSSEGNSSSDDSDSPFREMQADMKRQGKQPVSKQDSLIVDLKSVSSNLSPCCSGDQLEHEKLKEFVRFDFEHINLFSGDKSSRRKSVILIPSSIGRRIWVNKTSLDRYTGVELAPNAVLHSCNRHKPELRFHISSVSSSNDQLLIDVYVYNTFPRPLRFQTYLHAHSVSGRVIGPKIISTAHEFAIQPVQDNNVRVPLDLTDELRQACTPGYSYLIVTLMGRILH